jgi:4-hydroxy-2-oxoheptanedioate aldolase
MRTNFVKEKIKAGEKICGIILTVPDFQTLEIMGNLGFDFVFIEGEHGAFSLKDIEETCITANALGMTVHARVPNIHPSTILRFLDRGVQGIIGPHIRSRSDAEALVTACRFAPQGIRSFFPSRSADYIFGDNVSSYMASANEQMWVTALLEDREAVEENLQEILSVEGLDAVSIGYVDLSQSMGHPGDWNHPEVAGAMDNAWEQIARAGKASGRELISMERVTELLISGGKEFLGKVKGK